MIRGPGVMPGYLTTRRRTPTAFFDGWFRTGDQGVLEDGYLRLRRAAQGDDHPRRREHLAARDRGRAARAPARRPRRWRSASPTTKYGQIVGAAVVLHGAATPERASPPRAGAAGGVQGARASSTSWTRSRGRRPARCSGSRMPAQLRAAADEVRDPRRGGDRRLRRARRSRAAGRTSTLIARGEHLRAHAAHGVRVPQPARGLRGRPGGHRRARGDRGRRRRRARRSRRTASRSSRRGIGELLRPATRRSSRRRTGCPGGTSRGSAASSTARVRRERRPWRRRQRGRSSRRRVVGCVVYCSTEIVEPGVIRHIEGTRFTIGEPDGGPSDALPGDLRGVRRRRAEVPGRAEDLRPQIWLKLIGNVAFNPIDRADRRHARRARAHRRSAVALARGGDGGVRSGRRGARASSCRYRSSGGSRRGSRSATTARRCCRTSRPESRSRSTA